MSRYVVTIRGGKKVTLTEDEGWNLKNVLTEARSSFVEIGDDMVRASEIVSLVKEQLTEADVQHDLDESKLIEAKGHCRGQFSIQHEINMTAFKLHKRKCQANPNGLTWGELIKDFDWRERVRQALKARQPDGWCDQYANQCNCEADYHSDSARHVPEGVELVASRMPLESRRDMR